LSGPHKLLAAFNLQAYYCRDLGSPFVADLCETFGSNLKPNTAVAEKLFNWPGDVTAGGASLPLRMMGCLHRLVISGESPELKNIFPPNKLPPNAWPLVEQALIDHEQNILHQLQQAPQTNEVRRSAILFAGFQAIAKQLGNLPMVTSELGASAGLNIHWDKFHYKIGKQQWGNSDARINLEPKWTGAIQDYFDLRVSERAGCDLNPIDLSDQKKVETLLSYLWADQPERIIRTRHAIEIFNEHENRISKEGAVNWLKHRLSHKYDNQVHVIYHTIARQYFSEADKQESKALIEAAGVKATKSAPLAWLRFEADGQKPGAALTLRLWPGGDEQFLGRADYHGRWIDWR